MVSKNCGFQSWKGWNIWTFVYWNQLLLNSLRLCNKWSSCHPVRLNKNEGLSLLTGGQYAHDRVGERRKFFTLIFQWQGHLILKIKKNSDKKMLHIAPDKLQSALGLKLPPVFTFFPCLAFRPGQPPGGQGGRRALQGHHGPKYQLLHMEQLGGAPLEFVESSDCPQIMRLYWQ